MSLTEFSVTGSDDTLANANLGFDTVHHTCHGELLPRRDCRVPKLMADFLSTVGLVQHDSSDHDRAGIIAAVSNVFIGLNVLTEL